MQAAWRSAWAEAKGLDSNRVTHRPFSALTHGHAGAHATYRLDGLQQPDAELLNAAVRVRKLHESLARSRLRLPHPDHGEHVPEGCTTSLP